MIDWRMPTYTISSPMSLRKPGIDTSFYSFPIEPVWLIQSTFCLVRTDVEKSKENSKWLIGKILAELINFLSNIELASFKRQVWAKLTINRQLVKFQKRLRNQFRGDQMLMKGTIASSVEWPIPINVQVSASWFDLLFLSVSVQSQRSISALLQCSSTHVSTDCFNQLLIFF